MNFPSPGKRPVVGEVRQEPLTPLAPWRTITTNPDAGNVDESAEDEGGGGGGGEEGGDHETVMSG